jgi:hypothetical protein
VNFLENTQNTNVLLMEIPVRYDTEARPLICEQIVSYNKKLHNVTKKYTHVKLVRVTTGRNRFTNHGLHLNHTGKEAITKETLNNVPSNCEGQSSPAIQLPWKDECENVNAPNTEKESPKMILDNKADTEEARELIVNAGGKCVTSKTDAEARPNLAQNETAQHLNKQEISSNPPESGETSKEISRNHKPQRKCPNKNVKNDAFLWILMLFYGF